MLTTSNRTAIFDGNTHHLPALESERKVHTSLTDVVGFPTSHWSGCGVVNSLRPGPAAAMAFAAAVFFCCCCCVVVCVRVVQSYLPRTIHNYVE